MAKRKEPKVENRQVAILRDGIEGPFWQTIKKILEDEKSEINGDVLNREELALDDTAVTALIKWYNFLDYVVELPEMAIKSLERTVVNDGSEISGYVEDPYESPIAEVRQKIKNAKR